MPPLAVFLDSNAASYLIQRAGWSPVLLRTMREAFRRETKANRLNVIASMELFEELAGIAHGNTDLYRKAVGFVEGLAGSQILIPRLERMVGEATARGRLVGPARFVSRNVRQKIYSRTRSPSYAREVANRVDAWLTTFEPSFRAIREKARQIVGPNRTLNRREFLAALENLIGFLTSEFFDKQRVALKLPDDTSQWPSPREVPTAWHHYAYYAGRIALMVNQDRRLARSDYYDAAHYADAIYADVMVTDDGPFTETWAMLAHIPVEPFAVETLAEFAETRLGIPVT